MEFVFGDWDFQTVENRASRSLSRNMETFCVPGGLFANRNLPLNLAATSRLYVSCAIGTAGEVAEDQPVALVLPHATLPAYET
jgi:hypothetical protein